eukprot:scaffold123474_cov42-Prasinocladus_malaysianus.AAC.1
MCATGLFQVLVESSALGMDKLRFPNHVIRRLNNAIGQRRQRLAELRASAGEADRSQSQTKSSENAAPGMETEATCSNDKDQEQTAADEGMGESEKEEDEKEEEEDEEEEDRLLGVLRGGTMQCIYAMFGLDVPQRDPKWGDRLLPLGPPATTAHPATTQC